MSVKNNDINKILFIRLFSKTSYQVYSPPFGVAYVISYLRKKKPYLNISLYDMLLEGTSTDRMFAHIKKTSPDVVCFSLTYLERDIFIDISRILKREFPEMISVAGGSGISSAPVEFLENSDVDFVVQAEGESRMVDIVDSLEKARNPAMDGIGYWEKGNIRFEKACSYFDDLDDLEFPAWDVSDLKAFSKLPNLTSMLKGKKYAQVITSRGCPFICPYCQNYYLTGTVKHRKRSVEDLIMELSHLKSIGVDEIHILDDTFNLPIDRAKKIMRAIIEHDFGFHITFQGIRMEFMDEELFSLMKEAGTYKMEFGIQHVDEDIVRTMGRTNREDLKKIRKNVKIARKYNIITYGYFIYGFPGEKMSQSIKNLKASIYVGCDIVAFFKLVPLPGTQYYKLLKAPLSIPAEHFHFFNDCEELTLSEYSADEMNRLQISSYRNFYFSNLRFIRTMLKLPLSSYWINIMAFGYFKDIMRLFFEKIKNISK